MTTTTRVPAGWYPDPLGDAGTTRRWWNGEIWTEYTAPLSFGSPASGASTSSAAASAAEDAATTASGGTVAGTPLAPTAHDSALAALAMTLHAGSPAASPWDALPSVASATVFSPAAVTPASGATGATAIRPAPIRRRTIASADPAEAEGTRAVVTALDELAPLAAPAVHPVARPAARVHTSAVWIMTAMPAVHLLLAVAMATQYPVDAPGWTVVLALLLPLICCTGLADVDARQLGEDGHLRVAPWGLALVAPPLYLLVRAALLARVRRAAWAPLIVWIAVQVAVLALGLLLAPAALAAVVALIV